MPRVANKNESPKDVFLLRRQSLLAQLTSDDVVILPAAKEYLRTPEIEYQFRQENNVLYLTDYPETDSVVVLLPKRDQGEFVLFNLPKDQAREVWTGKRIGQEGAILEYHADQAYSIEDLKHELPALLQGRKRVYFPLYSKIEDKHVMLHEEDYLLDLLNKHRLEIVNVLPLLSEMRLIKSDAEVAIMEESIRITRAGHLNAMRHCRPGFYEYQLDAKLSESFYDLGSRYPAYPNVIGSGPTACTLHYESNNRQIQNGDLVLIDAGAEYKGYAADITRTFPANGRFTPEQKQIYNIVLKAQAAGIAATKPGVTWKEIRELVARTITQGLVDIGILSGDVDTLMKNGEYKKFYMHGPGHWIGLDTHDVGTKDKDGDVEARPFVPGMVLTMEPGIYISDQHKDIPAKWYNTAVRIEDMLLVTEEGCRVLSASIPKSVNEVEFIMTTARAATAGLPRFLGRHHDQPMLENIDAADRLSLRRSI